IGGDAALEPVARAVERGAVVEAPALAVVPVPVIVHRAGVPRRLPACGSVPACPCLPCRLGHHAALAFCDVAGRAIITFPGAASPTGSRRLRSGPQQRGYRPGPSDPRPRPIAARIMPPLESPPQHRHDSAVM